MDRVEKTKYSVALTSYYYDIILICGSGIILLFNSGVVIYFIVDFYILSRDRHEYKKKRKKQLSS